MTTAPPSWSRVLSVCIYSIDGWGPGTGGSIVPPSPATDVHDGYCDRTTIEDTQLVHTRPGHQIFRSRASLSSLHVFDEPVLLHIETITHVIWMSAATLAPLHVIIAQHGAAVQRIMS